MMSHRATSPIGAVHNQDSTAMPGDLHTTEDGRLWNRYGPTAARRGGAPGRDVRPSSPTVDIHAHVVIGQATEFVRPHIDWSTVSLAHFATEDTKAISRLQDRERTPTMSRVDLRLADMDAMGVDVQVISPSPFQCYYTLPIELADTASRLVNDGIAEHAGRKPDRLIPLGTVPLQDGRAAVAELRRCMLELGFKGVQVLTNVAGRELSDPDLQPFWQAAEELGALVVLHPNGFTEAQRLSRFYLNNVIGNPLETTIALHYLIFDGVLERFPNLKLLAVHGGGFTGAYSARMDHAWGARADCRATLPHPPTEYLRRVYVDTVVFSPGQLDYLLRNQGVERVVMGTDYAFDMAEYDPVAHVMGNDWLSDEQRSAVTGGNALRLLGMQEAASS